MLIELPAKAKAGFNLENGTGNILGGEGRSIHAGGESVASVNAKAEPLEEVEFEANHGLPNQHAVAAVFSGPYKLRVEINLTGPDDGGDAWVNYLVAKGRVGKDKSGVLKIKVGRSIRRVIHGKSLAALPSTVAKEKFFAEFKAAESAADERPIVPRHGVIVGGAAPGATQVEVTEQGAFPALVQAEIGIVSSFFRLVGEDASVCATVILGG